MGAKRATCSQNFRPLVAILSEIPTSLTIIINGNAASSKRVFVKIVYMDPTVIILAVVAINS